MSNEDLKAKVSGGGKGMVVSAKDQATSMVMGLTPQMSANLTAIGIPVERFRRTALTALLSNGASLMQCERVSLMSSLMRASELGLEIGHGASIVPFKGKAQLIIEARGLLKLAIDCGMVLSFDDPVIVYPGEYREWKDEAGPHFKYEPMDNPQGDPVGVLFGVQLASKAWKYVFTGTDRIALAKAKSKRPECYDFANEMWQAYWKKTGIINTLKYVPKSPKFVQATQADQERADSAEYDSVTGEVIDDGYREGQE